MNDLEKTVNQGDQSAYIENTETVNIYKKGKNPPKVMGNTPLYPDVFLGRENDLTNIHTRLFNDKNLLLLVNGQGGIGKTTVASVYYHQYFCDYRHLIWVVLEESIEDALIGLTYDLELKFADDLPQSERVRKIISALMSLKAPCLLVIDNANDLKSLSQTYKLLRRCPNLHLIITTRISEYEKAEIYPINALNETKAKELFREHYPDQLEEDKFLSAILTAVGYNTLVIELMSKNLFNVNNALKIHYSLEDLLADLQRVGILNLRKTKKITTDYTLHPATPEEIVSAMYNIGDLSEREKRLLSVFSVLPTENIPFYYLVILLPDFENLDDCLILLSQKGWIDFDKKSKSFKCNPVVQEIVRNQNRDRLLDDIELTIDILSNLFEYEENTGNLKNLEFKQAIPLVLYAKQISKYLNSVENVAIQLLLNRIGTFFFTHGNLLKALECFEKWALLQKELYESNLDILSIKSNLAMSYGNLGDTHSKLGNLDNAFEYYEETIELSEELYKSNPDNVIFKGNLAVSHSKIGDTLSTLGNLDKALEHYEEMIELFEELYKSNPDNVRFKDKLATSHSKIGDTLSTLGNLDKALDCFLNGVRLSQELYESNPNNVGFKYSHAMSYLKLGSAVKAVGNFDVALGCFGNTMILLKELYESNPDNMNFKESLAISYSNLGDAQSTLGNLDKALEYFEEKSMLGKELYESNPDNVDFKDNLAISYSKLGDMHSKLGNLDKALEYNEEATKLFEELHKLNPKNMNFKKRFAISYSRLGDTHSTLGNLDKALDRFGNHMRLSKELYESNPDNVDFKNGLAISYSKLGDMHSRLGNFDKVLENYEEMIVLFEDLHKSNPKNMDFKNGLAMSYSKLGVMHSRLGNFDVALGCFENTMILSKNLYKSNPDNVDFKDNLAIIKLRLGGLYSTLGNLDKALDCFENGISLSKELYESNPDNMSFKNSLALFYAEFGVFNHSQKKDKERALIWLLKAQAIWKELVDSFPSYVEFQKYLENVKKDIKFIGKSKAE